MLGSLVRVMKEMLLISRLIILRTIIISQDKFMHLKELGQVREEYVNVGHA